MFRIKICGITTPDDALACVSAGADALGLNFYKKSPRCVSAQRAAEIGAIVSSNTQVSSNAQKVGVFVNLPASEVNGIAATAKLSWVQLHGDEPPEMIAEIAPAFRVLRVYRYQPGDESRIAADLQRCQAAGRMPDAVLLDAPAKAQHSGIEKVYGGSGESIGWSNLQGDRPWLQGLPLVLAGGLNPGNVFAAAQTVRPEAVDVASGVESAPGIKSADQVAKFILNARRGLGF